MNPFDVNSVVASAGCAFLTCNPRPLAVVSTLSQCGHWKLGGSPPTLAAPSLAGAPACGPGLNIGFRLVTGPAIKMWAYGREGVQTQHAARNLVR
jgi:hypothetical protein